MEVAVRVAPYPEGYALSVQVIQNNAVMVGANKSSFSSKDADFPAPRLNSNAFTVNALASQESLESARKPVALTKTSGVGGISGVVVVCPFNLKVEDILHVAQPKADKASLPTPRSKTDCLPHRGHLVRNAETDGICLHFRFGSDSPPLDPRCDDPP